MSVFQSAHSPKRNKCVYTGALLSAMLVLAPVASASAVDTVTPPAPAETAETVAPQGAEADAAASSFTLSTTSALPGTELTIDYATDTPHAENWIGIYNSTATPGGPASIMWQYTPDAQGSLAFKLDLAPGTYHVWFLSEGGYDALAEMQTLEVLPDPANPQLVPGDPNAPVEIDPVATDASTDGVIMRETFGGGALPEGWSGDFTSAHEGAEAYAGWQPTTRADWSATIDQMRDRFGRTEASFLVADAQQFGGSDFAATLTSAPIDVNDLDAVRLTFDSHYRGAAGQTGVVTASFDGADPVEVLRLDSTTVTDVYDGMQMNAAQDLTVDTPARAKQVVFSWEFTGGEGARYWGIDQVTAHQVLAPAAGTPTQAWVVSDIQGHPNDLAHGLEDFKKISPDANGLLMVGDIVNSGSVAEWQEIYDVMDGSKDIRPPQTVAGMGNHERYAVGGFDANFQRFLDFAERDKSWGEYVLEGPSGDLPVIVLGQEMSGPSDVPMTEAQVKFLEERLAFWTEQDKQVVVMSHFPLGNTVSASSMPWYSNHHQHNNRLTSILGNYPNAVVFSGHTHYPAELGDWAMQRRTADGHADGFWSINTLAMHIEWDLRGEDTKDVTEVTTRDVNRGLTLDAYEDRMVITAHDFATDQQLSQVTITNPLVPFASELAPDSERDANYDAVDAALAAVPADLTGFTAKSVKALQTAIDAVDRTLAADAQAQVDAMAQAITDAIAALTPETPGPADAGAEGISAADTNGAADATANAGAGAGAGAETAAANGAAAAGADGSGSGSDAAPGAKPASTQGAGAGLANTGGAGTGGIIAGALALLAAGGALIVKRRRGTAQPE
ncbi:putative phosphodiesterase [Leucobacter exalbidus]|uniref:Phosphodiesterase n=1 Tax=Leucobacter exalbidus TaxID=662960 RepID=A0A940T379_9MICO|nr:DUF4073 domain-containing protein [Leucobacter exalbidus]MBP1325877.1 putative phosphodiesterase [Leucobacter exalbidus]